MYMWAILLKKMKKVQSKENLKTYVCGIRQKDLI